jgi:hypothetical protein
MTDMAAGAQAARQMQQNVIGAQYDQGYADAAAEDTQLKLEGDRLKLQGDRLKAAYAPQQAAAEAEAEKMRLDKMRLARTMEEAQYKSDTDTDARLKTWLTTDEGTKATDTEKLRKAAIFKMEGNRVKEGAELLDQAEKQDTRDIANQAKKIAAGNEAIAKAFVAVDALDPNDMPKFNAFVDRFPVEVTKAITDQVGAENWKAYSPQEKKEVLSRLFLNGKGLLAEQLKAVELQKTEKLTASREQISAERSAALVQIQTLKGTIDAYKADVAKAAKLEEQAAKDIAAATRLTAELKNKLDIAEKKNASLEEVAITNAVSREQVAEIKKTSAKEVADTKATSAKEVADVKAASAKEVAAAKAASDKVVADTKAASDKVVADTKAASDKEVAEIRAKYESVKAEADKVKAAAETVRAEAAKIRAEAEKTKADKPSTTKAGDELKDLDFYFKRHDAIIREGKKEEDALSKQVSDADAVLQKAKTASWFNISAPNQDKATNVYTEAVAKLNAFRKKQAEKELAVVEDMPEFDKKASIVKRLQDQIQLFSSDKPESKAPAAAPAPAAAAAPAVVAAPAASATAAGKVSGATSNKFNPEQQAWFNAAKKANPTMSDADIIAEGKKRKKL